MTILADFAFSVGEDVVLQINVVPPTDITSWPLKFEVMQRFGGTSGLITKWSDTANAGTSGITKTDASAGQFSVNIWQAIDTSGLASKNYAYSAQSLLSGSRSVLTEGYIELLPNIGGG